MFNKNKLIKLTVTATVATTLFTTGEALAGNNLSTTVEAASNYKITLKHNAYIYNLPRKQKR